MPNVFLDQPDNAIRRDDDEADQKEADNQKIDRGRNGHGGDLLQRAEQDSADQRADPARGAANQRHGDGIHRIVEAERRGRLQIADVVGKRRSGQPISAPEIVVAISLSRSVGTPDASAASSSSRIVAKP